MIIEEKKKIETKNRNGKRYYHIKNKWLVSVTSVLQYIPAPGLEKWKRRKGYTEAERIRKTSAQIGELVHYYIGQIFKERSTRLMAQDIPDFLMEMSYEEMQKYIPYVERAMALTEEFWDVWGKKIEIVDIERTIVNMEIGYAGRYDFRFYLYENGRKIPCLGDIKTGKRIYEKYGIQASAYNKAMDDWAKRYYILKVYPYDDFNDPLKMYNNMEMHWEFTEVEGDFKIFLDCIQKYRKEQKFQKMVTG